MNVFLVVTGRWSDESPVAVFATQAGAAEYARRHNAANGLNPDGDELADQDAARVHPAPLPYHA